MLSLAVLLPATLVAAWLAQILYRWRSNYVVAKASGIPIVLVPIDNLALSVRIPLSIIEPLLDKLPSFLTNGWIRAIKPMRSWKEKYNYYRDLGTDSFIMVSPWSSHFYTCDAQVIAQITARRRDFPKPSWMYRNLDVFGRNVVSAEGDDWRQQRKVVAPPFTEKNNHLVWGESIYQAQCMIKVWTEKALGKPVCTVADDSMRLSLNVISRAGFGIRLTWPQLEEPKEQPGEDGGDAGTASLNKWPGHELTFIDALGSMIHNVVLIVLFKNMLAYLPFNFARKAHLAWKEWGGYMADMLNKKRAEFDSGSATQEQGIDLLGAMYRASQGETKDGTPALTDEVILGNAFVFIFAGHETTANSMHFCFIYLAMNPDIQRRLQDEVAQILGGRSPEQWSYDHDMPRLWNSMLGAVMMEQLRLITPVLDIPKSVVTAQHITIDGKRCVIPANCLVNLTTVAAQRNPRYWPCDDPEDLNQFRPQRWLTGASAAAAAAPKTSTLDTDATNKDISSTSTLYKPVEGSYIPFSDGARACLGKRFAQVELMAVLAVVFSQYSVELVADEWAAPDALAGMPAAEKRRVWTKARDRAQMVFDERMMVGITLRMQYGEYTPLRFVKRGEEVYKGVV